MRKRSVSWFNHRNFEVHIPKALLQYWGKLTPEQRHSLISYYWSLNVCMNALFILAAVSITVQQVERVVFEVGTVDGEYEDVSFTLPEDFDLGRTSEITAEEPAVEIPALSESTLDTPELSISDLTESTSGGNQEEASEIESSDSGLSSSGGLTGHESGLVADTNRKVAQAGGNLNGPIRISLSFLGDDDLDLHLSYEVTGRSRKRETNMLDLFPVSPLRHLFYAFKQTEHAVLDVDANAAYLMPEPCENIVFHTKPPKTRYTIVLDNFEERGIPDETQYVIVVKYGERTKVFEGKLRPTDRVKEIWSFRY